MYPTLLQIGSFRLDSYSVIWFFALSIAIFWSINRLSLYNLDEDEARRIMAISFLFMLLGARAPEYIKNFRDYVNDPSLLLDLNHGGLEEGGAIVGAILAAMILCYRSKKISFLELCEVSAIPGMLAICIGRWGCFLNGCCVGLESHFWTALHFPNDKAGITRHPVQIYYSLFAFVNVLILLWVEKKVLPRKRKVITPMALILYAVMRLSIAFVREPESLFHYWNYNALIIALPLECLWLAVNLRKIFSDKHE
ncbi:MAG: prolipoprotein diacylglyceryl transferase [Synergistaceae bacterium]|nr:prolipoprotein diacylglyceryl transferase [Synergistaceae bacterium]